MSFRSLSHLSDEQLFFRLQSRDTNAFAEIYERYWALLLLNAARILNDEEEAKDVVQEVFSKLWDRGPELNVNTLSSYLYSSVRNKTLDLIDKKKVQNNYISSLQGFIDKSSFETDALIRERQLAKSIEAGIESLPEKMREVFLLSRREELSYRNISDLLNISENTVKKQVSNALKILRLKLNGMFSFFFNFFLTPASPLTVLLLNAVIPHGTMENKDAKSLLQKYLNGVCTEEEKAVVESWYLMLAAEKKPFPDILNDEHKEELWQRVKPAEPILRPVWSKIAAAAAILLVIGVGIYLNMPPKVAPNLTNVRNKPNDIEAGTKKAVLTLADGSEQVLDDAARRIAESQGGAAITQAEGGKLQYRRSGPPENFHLAYNKITVPRASEYQVTLSDGTKVWLNASSSLSFPVVFKKHERKVQLTGEAYFEVAKDKEAPFTVIAKGTEVRVLGTHFNLSAYEDESSTTTTLVEGAVRVSKNQAAALLKPGQKSMIFFGKDDISVSEANLDEAVAWKEGYFTFSGEDIENIMRKVERWYDVEIVYEAKVHRMKFSGTFSRNKRISELLRYLEKLGPNKFRIEGRRIFIMK